MIPQGGVAADPVRFRRFELVGGGLNHVPLVVLHLGGIDTARFFERLYTPGPLALSPWFKAKTTLNWCSGFLRSHSGCLKCFTYWLIW